MNIVTNISKNSSISKLWFKQLRQTKLTRLERDLQPISRTPSFLTGGLLKILNDIIHVNNKLIDIEGKHIRRGVDV